MQGTLPDQGFGRLRSSVTAAALTRRETGTPIVAWPSDWIRIPTATATKMRMMRMRTWRRRRLGALLDLLRPQTPDKQTVQHLETQCRSAQLCFLVVGPVHSRIETKERV